MDKLEFFDGSQTNDQELETMRIGSLNTADDEKNKMQVTQELIPSEEEESYSDVKSELESDTEEPLSFSVLDTYGEDLTLKKYVANPAIARDEEIKRLMIVL